MKTTIIVQNLKCRGCANSITTKLAALPNITSLEVDIAASSVSFRCSNGDQALTVKKKLKEMGYPSIDVKNSALFKAKSLVNCATGKLAGS